MLQFAEGQRERQSPRRILDVCTGSGVQALATLAMLELVNGCVANLAVAVDVNERALSFTAFNARLNGLEDRVSTMAADLLSGKAFPSKYEESKADDRSLVEALLNKLVQDEGQRSFPHEQEEEERKFDMFLANPPFIPVPPERSDRTAFSLRDKNGYRGANTPRYGLFSSGGASGEDCLRAIIQLAPSLLRTNGGLMVVVSEFMNPPPLPSTSQESPIEEDDLTAKIKDWWGSQSAASRGATGVLFTNEFAISSDIYAQRRAMTNDEEDINVWYDHLYQSGIRSVSPGLLFIRTENGESEQNGIGFKLKHLFVPKTKHGSIWTPQNFVSVEFTRDMVMPGVFR
mmetsp:Transcript_37934/g.81043  ORF Transcript_37934/g.81043 Transcript_37934/m.81043 type:complete len:344 (-) Transcript_37934:86-1117(-)